jgi:hypothetical protein
LTKFHNNLYEFGLFEVVQKITAAHVDPFPPTEYNHAGKNPRNETLDRMNYSRQGMKKTEISGLLSKITGANQRDK